MKEVTAFLEQQSCPNTAKVIQMLLQVPTPPQRPLRAMLPFGRFEAFKILETRLQRAEEAPMLQLLLQQLGNTVVFINMLQESLLGCHGLGSVHRALNGLC